MSKLSSIDKISTGVQIVNQDTGESVRNSVPLPDSVKNRWDIRYDDYVRIGVVGSEGSPVISFEHLGEMEYKSRSNDLKITNTGLLPLPRRVVRLFGIEEDIWWEACGTKLIGKPMRYNDAGKLYDVAKEYASYDIPRLKPFRDGEKPLPRTDFGLLTEEAPYDNVFYHSELNPSKTYKERASVRHLLPSASFDFESGEYYRFLLFHDGDEFIVGLLPAPAQIDVSSSKHKTAGFDSFTLKSVYLPDGGKIRAENIEGTRIGHTRQIEPGAHNNVTVNLYDEIQSPTQIVVKAMNSESVCKSDGKEVTQIIDVAVDGEKPAPLPNDFSIKETKESSVDMYSMRHNPLSASPHDRSVIQDTDDSSRETEKYETDLVKVHQDDDGRFYYTLPKQIAESLWLEDGYNTDWVKVNDGVFFGRLTPESRSKVERHSDPKQSH